MIVLGAFMLVATFRQIGFDWRGITGYVLGAALAALGIVRFREFARRKGPAS